MMMGLKQQVILLKKYRRKNSATNTTFDFSCSTLFFSLFLVQRNRTRAIKQILFSIGENEISISNHQDKTNNNNNNRPNEVGQSASQPAGQLQFRPFTFLHNSIKSNIIYHCRMNYRSFSLLLVIEIKPNQRPPPPPPSPHYYYFMI